MPQQSPIIDAILELRFETSMPSQVIVGLLYQSFDNELTNVEDLPILQLPAEIRQNDPNLKLQPQYRVSGENFIVSIGEGLIGVSVVVDRNERYYPGWEVYEEFINKVIDFINENQIATTFKKVDVRYINCFDEDGIIDKANIEVKVAGEALTDQNLTLFFEKNHKPNKVKIQLAGKANVKSAYLNLDGSIVDIGAYDENGVEFSKVKEKINELHDIVEDNFFEIVKRDKLPEGVEKRDK